ncbi:MAG: transglutaminase-like domain-containing protein [Candidatus Azobacteroides sp.]|nr:transglutaminase-like domain-containing protein [Candidatus Azobacteroides sp.]
MKRLLQLLLFLFLFASCHEKEDRLEQALRQAGKNRKELEKVLSHYQQLPDGEQKYKAACFLIENMLYHYQYEFPTISEYYQELDSLLVPEKMTKEYIEELREKIKTVEYKIDQKEIRIKEDIRHITAEFLIRHIDHVFELSRYPWCRELSFEDFCEYLLPYRLAREPLEDWIPIYQEQLSGYIRLLVDVEATDSMVCEAFRLYFLGPNEWYIYHFKLDFPPSAFFNKGAGTCYELAMLTTYTLRSLGIPTAWDFTPQWANRSQGHDWNLVFLAGDKQAPF